MIDLPFKSRVYRRRGGRPSAAALCAAGLALVAVTSLVGVCGGAAVEPARPNAARPEPPATAKRLAPASSVWVDAAAKRVYVGGEVTLREGVLEMFACPKGTKEHESVVAVDSPAFLVHTALLAIGAEPGAPVRFDPKYEPPRGAEINIRVEWFDAAGDKQSSRAQDWVRDLRTKRPMDLPFVFAGSGFWTDPDSGEQRYLAESGDLVCVSNFASATLDVPAASTQSNAELLFEPFTERVPERGTPVMLVMSVGDAAAVRPVSNTTTSQSPPDATFRAALDALRGANESEGSSDALRAAWNRVAAASIAELPLAVRALSGAAPTAENWLRSAIDAGAERLGSKLPTAPLAAIVADSNESPRARRTAFEWLVEADPARRLPLLEQMINDPSLELRYDAVGLLLEQAGAAEGEGAKRLYERALAAARSLDQIEAAEAGLKKQGVEVNLAERLGVVSAWSLIGPFENREGVGFDAVYPPEHDIDTALTHPGKPGEPKAETVAWKAYTTSDRLGEVDVNTAVGPFKGAVAYALASVKSDAERNVEVRYTSRAATKVWVNGELVATNQIYHDGSEFDQYRAAARLVAGENTILVKVCQNEQTEPWAQVWQFALRVSDRLGGRIEGITQVSP
ncbi:MAG: YdjY domain-containing protein [Lacipirellulaceae bacterium]